MSTWIPMNANVSAISTSTSGWHGQVRLPASRPVTSTRASVLAHATPAGNAVDRSDGARRERAAAEFAPKGPEQISPGQSVAPPWVDKPPRNEALKGRNNAHATRCVAPSGLGFLDIVTQGGATRLTPLRFALGWYVETPSGRKVVRLGTAHAVVSFSSRRCPTGGAISAISAVDLPRSEH